MSSELRKIPLGELTTYKKGFAFKSANYQDKGITVIRVSNFFGDSIDSSDLKYVSRFIADTNRSVSLKENDIVVATVGSWPNNPLSVVGRTVSVPSWASGALMNQNSVIIRSSSANFFDQKFIYYQMKTSAFKNHIISKAQGSANQASITLNTIFSYPIWWPDQVTRKKVAEILFKIDCKVTLLQEKNKTLESIAQILFKSWFVDFDPVFAKQEGRQPEGMDELTAALFPGNFEQSELGEIPMGWEIKELKNVFDLFGGQAFKSKDYTSQGIFVLRTNNFKKGIAIKNHNDVFLPNSFLDLYKNFVCEAFDYHLVMVGASIGNTGMILPHLLPALRNQNMWCFRPKNKEVISRLYLKFVIDKTSKELINFASGSARDFFKRDDFKNHKLIIPTEKILKSYSKIVDPFLEEISMNSNKIETLLNLRDILLPRLILGQLRLSGTEEIMNNKTKVTA